MEQGQSTMISIIIPVFNPGNNLGILLNCVRAQSEKNFEALLIDDGSTDGSSNICDMYSRLDPRFRVIHQENRGVSSSRNLGLNEANAEYITFLDADDEIPENYLEVLLQTHINTKADITVCDVVLFKDNKEIQRFTHCPAVLESSEAMNLLLSRRQINSGPCAKLYNANIVNNISFPSLKVYEDILFVRDAFSIASKVAVTDRTEYCYKQNSGSATDAIQNAPTMDIVKATDNLAGYICSHSELDPCCLYITLSHMMQYVLPILDSRREDHKRFVKEARHIMKKYRRSIVKCSAFPWKEKILFLCFSR